MSCKKKYRGKKRLGERAANNEAAAAVVIVSSNQVESGSEGTDRSAFAAVVVIAFHKATKTNHWPAILFFSVKWGKSSRQTDGQKRKRKERKREELHFSLCSSCSCSCQWPVVLTHS